MSEVPKTYEVALDMGAYVLKAFAPLWEKPDENTAESLEGRDGVLIEIREDLFTSIMKLAGLDATDEQCRAFRQAVADKAYPKG